MNKPKQQLTLALAICLCLLPFALQAADRDSVVVGLRVEPPGLDQTIRQGGIINIVTLENIYEGLTRFTNDGKVVPALAKSWTISPDGKTYTFVLLEGVKFADGTDFDSADVKWKFEKNAAPDSTNPKKKIFQSFEKIETPDSHTVVIHLKNPNSLLLGQLAWGVSVIHGPESAPSNATNPIGTGPFKLEKWSKGSSIVLVHNPFYRDRDRISIKKVTFRIITDPLAQVAAIKAGDVDILTLFSSPESLGQFENDPKIQVLLGASESEVLFGFNDRRPPFTDARVRRALMHAIDRKAVIDGAEFGYGTPIGSHFSVNHPAYVNTTKETSYDPEKAKALLRDAGYANGFEMTIKVPPQAPFIRGAEIIQAYLGKVGVKVELEKQQWAQWLEAVFTNHDFDTTIVDHPIPMDILIFADPDYFYGYDDKEFQQLWAKIESATTQAQQYELLRQAQWHLAKDAPVGFLYQTQNIAVVRSGLKGVWNNMPHFMLDLADVRWEQ